MPNQLLDDIARALRPIDLPLLPQNPLVSVLVTNYNYADYIGEAIESVVEQSYANFELIICDDGSTDDSCAIVEKHARRDPRIRLVRQPNSGQAAALNSAYRESRGEIICLLDADDRFLPEKLETVVRAFRARPDAGFLAHRVFCVDEEGRRASVLPLLWEPPSGWYGPYVLRTCEPPPGLVPTSGLCLRREVASLIWPLPERPKYGGEGAVDYVAPLITLVIGVTAPLAEYRYHGRNIFNWSELTERVLDLQQEIHKTSWGAQRDYLQRTDRRFAQIFPPVERRMGFQLATYLRTRLANEGGVLAAYRNLVQTRRFASSPIAVRWFWRASLLLPLPAFRMAVELLWGQRGQGRVKPLLFRAARLVRGGKTLKPERLPGV